MAYLLLIHAPRGQRASRSEVEGCAAYECMVQYGLGPKERGLLLASESLQSDGRGVRLPAARGATACLMVRSRRPRR